MILYDVLETYTVGKSQGINMYEDHLKVKYTNSKDKTLLFNKW